MIVSWNLEVRETPSYLGSLSVNRHWVLWSPSFRQHRIATTLKFLFHLWLIFFVNQISIGVTHVLY